MAFQPNDAYRARFPLPNLQTVTGTYPTSATVVVPVNPAGGCDCATPRTRDLETGEWLHLETMSPRPKRRPAGA
jgi:hypothetical protein